ncbi:MAG TPA: preprotein translocase subunit YajC [Myxococcota bacterium]|jgi:preprotein translocase subunit YajC|nr:preprotein translocase subunit YajC [Myxococcota bacterium]
MKLLLPVVVLLQAAGAPQNPFGGVSMLLPFAAIFLIFYFLLIRPQQKRQKEQEDLLKSIAKGDEVVTSGGIYGKVTGTSDEVLTLEIAAAKGEPVRVKVDRARIERRVKKAKEGEEK